ncbi:Uncharacterised protein [Legionella moravica]|uniref:Uncharacterized protein n=1 Tax=Legionella moravica TaxID=39962 RepID=A0A378JY75_9GAMM|nr:Uncharacterised protein [Legionella moravica]
MIKKYGRFMAPVNQINYIIDTRYQTDRGSEYEDYLYSIFNSVSTDNPL